MLSLETRTMGDDIYFMLLDIQPLGFLDLSFLKNKWLTTKKIESEINKEDTPKNLSPEIKEEIAKIVKENQIYEYFEKIDSEVIDDIKTNHFKYKIDNEKFLILIEKITKIILKEDSDELALQIEQIKDFPINTEPIEGEIWVGKKDFLLYKMTMRVKVKEIENSNLISDFNLSINLKNYNKDLIIEEPESSENIEKFIQELFLGMSSDVSEENELSENGELYREDELYKEEKLNINSDLDIEALKFIDNDNDGLSDYEEVYIYRTDPLNWDSDGDGYSDGEEVRNGYDPNV